MTVLRVRKTENFVIIHKGALEDPKLSFKAKGLWTYCLSRPDDWVFHVKHLATVSQDGEDAVYSAIKELEEAGYVKKIQHHINGRFQKVDYEIFEIPQIQIILPQPEKQEAVFQEPVNPALLSIEPILRNEKTVCPEPPVGVPEPPKKVFKTKTDGTNNSIELDEVFRKSVQQNKNWTEEEIKEAWKVLEDYKGRVNDMWKFLEGTIENLRKRKNIEKLKKTDEVCQKKNTEISGPSKTLTQEEIDMRLQHSQRLFSHLKTNKK